MSIPIPASLDPEEQQLPDFEAGELRSVATPALLGQLQQAAKATGLNDHRINIRPSIDGLQTI